MANAVLKYQRELAEWKAQGKAIIESAEQADRDLSDDENKDLAEIEAEIGRCDARLQRALKAQQWERDEAVAIQNDEVEREAVDALNDDPPAAKPFSSFGEQLQAIHRAGTSHAVDPRLLEIGAAAQGAGETEPAGGGFLVQTDFAAEILRKMFDSGAVASRVRMLPLSGNSNSIRINALKETSRAAGSRYGGVQGYWVDEGTAATASKPTFRQITLALNDLMCLGYATNDLLQDTTALESIMQEAFADELRFLFEDSLINGTGAGQPQGILNSGAEVSVAKETGQAAGTIVYENIVKMWSRMWARSRSGAVWFINQDVEPQLYTMSLSVGTGGVPVYLPAGGASGQPFGTLFGRPVIPVEYCATVGTVGDIILADMSQVIGIDKGGINSASSMHVAFTTNEMAFRAVYRVDARSTWESALTPFKGSNTQSPYITLATRS